MDLKCDFISFIEYESILILSQHGLLKILQLCLNIKLNVIKFKHADLLLAHYFQSIVKLEEDGIENLSLTVF